MEEIAQSSMESSEAWGNRPEIWSPNPGILMCKPDVQKEKKRMDETEAPTNQVTEENFPDV